MREIRLTRDLQNGQPYTSQSFTIPTTQQERLGFHFKYIHDLDRFAFDLTINDLPRLYGMTVLTGHNLLAPFGFNVGALFAVDMSGKGKSPGLTEIMEHSVRIFHFSEVERVNQEEILRYAF
ncbi:MAG: hypothetical protein AAF385_16070 [Pseudomonadota bacterium]